jgi:hypothetical protein
MMVAAQRSQVRPKKGGRAMSAKNCAAAKPTPIETAKNATIWTDY